MSILRRSKNIAFRLHRGRSAEDPRKTPAEVTPRCHHLIKMSTTPTGQQSWRRQIFRILILLAPRKIRGRSAEDIRGSHALGAPPSRKPRFRNHYKNSGICKPRCRNHYKNNCICKPRCRNHCKNNGICKPRCRNGCKNNGM